MTTRTTTALCRNCAYWEHRPTQKCPNRHICSLTRKDRIAHLYACQLWEKHPTYKHFVGVKPDAVKL